MAGRPGDRRRASVRRKRGRRQTVDAPGQKIGELARAVRVSPISPTTPMTPRAGAPPCGALVARRVREPAGPEAPQDTRSSRSRTPSGSPCSTPRRGPSSAVRACRSARWRRAPGGSRRREEQGLARAGPGPVRVPGRRRGVPGQCGPLAGRGDIRGLDGGGALHGAFDGRQEVRDTGAQGALIPGLFLRVRGECHVLRRGVNLPDRRVERGLVGRGVLYDRPAAREVERAAVPDVHPSRTAGGRPRLGGVGPQRRRRRGDAHQQGKDSAVFHRRYLDNAPRRQ